MIYKPQFGLLVPVALLAGRHWRAFLFAGLSAGALISISMAWHGPGLWTDYLRNLGVLRQIVLEDGTGVWHRFVSVFVAARRLGAPVEAAYAIQALTAAIALIAVALVWWRNEAPLGVKNAVLLSATCLATPYLQDYDLVFGALIVVWLLQAPAPRFERTLPVAAGLLLILPLLAAALANMTGLCLGPLFIAPIFFLAARIGLQKNLHQTV